MNLATFALLVMATWYGDPAHFGRPLYCDRGNGLVYATSTVDWVAVDVGLYESGQVRCGDTIQVRFPSGQVLTAQALDAGPLRDYRVAPFWDLPVMVDVPRHLWPAGGLSSPVRMINKSALMRELERRAGR